MAVFNERAIFRSFPFFSFVRFLTSCAWFPPHHERALQEDLPPLLGTERPLDGSCQGKALNQLFWFIDQKGEQLH